MRGHSKDQRTPTFLHFQHSMFFTRSIVEDLCELRTYVCYPCDLAFTGEAVAEALEMGMCRVGLLSDAGTHARLPSHELSELAGTA